MPVDRKATRWNGWGWTNAHNPIDGRDAVWPWIANALGMTELSHTPAKRLEDIALPPEQLESAAKAALATIVGPSNIRADALERASHARGKSYHDLLHLRAGTLGDAPDAVVYLRSADDVVRVLQWAEQHKVAGVPFAGGSSVVGG